MKDHSNLNNLEAKLIGNRITTSFRIIEAATIPLALNFFPTYPFTSLVAATISSFGWIMTEYETFFGLGTNKIYKKTKDHIKKYGRIDERFAKSMFNVQKNNQKYQTIDSKQIYGYCEWQGMYLASKSLGKTEQFQELKNKYYKKKFPLF